MRAIVIIIILSIAGYPVHCQYTTEGKEDIRAFSILTFLGDDFYLADSDSLIRLGREARQVSLQSGAREAEAQSIMVIAVGHIGKGDHKRALHLMNQALDIYKQIDHLKGQGDVLHCMGFVYEIQDDYSQSADFYAQSSSIYRQTGHQSELAYALGKLGDMHAHMKDHFQAMIYYREGLEIMQETGAQKHIARLHEKIGKTFHKLGEHARALAHLHTAFEISERTGNEKQMTTAQNYIGAVYLQQDAHDSATVYLEAAYARALRTGKLEHQKEVAENLVLLHEDQGNHAKALKFYKVLKSASDSLERKNKLARITQIKNDHAFELEHLHLQNQLKRQQLRQKLSMTGLGVALLLIFILTRYYQEKKQGLEALRKKNEEILKTRDQLIIQEKLASLGQLAAGIAHEIKNPLNFVNNFAEGSIELTEELVEELEKRDIHLHQERFSSIREIIEDLKQNSIDINHNGRRADRIVRSIMEHARGHNGEVREVDINRLIDENVNLAFHGYRAIDSSFSLYIEKDYDPMTGKVEVVPQDLGRVLLNIINNACYALNQKRKTSPSDFLPTLEVRTHALDDHLEIHIRDNGPGIPEEIRKNIFTPFFTTKPTGEGNTGLGLSISYDIIVNAHHGALKVESEPGQYTTFMIRLPYRRSSDDS
jgi:two-component system NtrC family sensor kinase